MSSTPEETATSSENMGFGQYLRRERESRGITLEQISQKTRIPIQTLKTLELNQLQVLPSGAFVKGFLRNIARELDLDPHELIVRYESAGAAPLPTSANVPTTPKRLAPRSLAPRGTAGSEETPVGPQEKKPLPWQAYVFAGLLLVLVGVILNYANQSSEPRAVNPEPIGDSPASEPAAASTVPGNVTADRPVTQVPVVPAVPTLFVRAKADTWFRVGMDQKLPTQVFLRKDQTVTYQAEKRFELTLGDPSAVEIVYNNKTLPALGEKGVVRRLILPSAEFP